MTAIDPRAAVFLRQMDVGAEGQPAGTPDGKIDGREVTTVIREQFAGDVGAFRDAARGRGLDEATVAALLALPGGETRALQIPSVDYAGFNLRGTARRAVPNPASVRDVSSQRDLYTVKRGDSLLKIASQLLEIPVDARGRITGPQAGRLARAFQAANPDHRGLSAWDGKPGSRIILRTGERLRYPDASELADIFGVRTTAYQSFEGVKLSLEPFVGDNVALLVSEGTDPTAMRPLVETVDRAYDFYAAATGREPGPYLTYRGRSTIAVVPSSCGAGCGYVGESGIELEAPTFERLLRGAADKGEYDQAVFYELGRNFWFYEDQLTGGTGDFAESVTTGYAVFMRFAAMDAAGAKPGPFDDVPFAQLRSEVEGLVDRYVDESAATFETTLARNAAPDNPLRLMGTDLFASMLMRLQAVHGEQFTQKVWKEVAKRPRARNQRAALDNLMIASSAAAGANLTPVFRDLWKLPVSGDAATFTGRQQGEEVDTSAYSRSSTQRPAGGVRN